jgi:hypothetical protein
VIKFKLKMKSSTLLESSRAVPRGKRLAPIKATDLKNKDIAMSPKAQETNFKIGDDDKPDTKKINSITSH